MSASSNGSYWADPGIRGQVALVTGGSRGIGRETALLFARAGAHVMIGYVRDHAAAGETLSRLRAHGVRAEACCADLTTTEGAAALHDAAVEKLGPVDILVNCAGVVDAAPAAASTDELWARMLALNAMGTVRMCRLVAPSMKARRRGRIVNVSSLAVHLPAEGLSAFSGAKAVVETLTRSLAVELRGPDMTVNCLCPGLIDTHDVRRRDEGLYLLEHQLVRRMGRADEVASWILLLASRHGGFCTGQIIRIDGGHGFASKLKPR